MKRIRSLLGPWTLVAGLVACGRGAPSINEVSMSDLMAAFNEAACTHQIRCGVARDRATCSDQYDPTLADRLMLFVDAVKAGTVTHDPARAAACFEAYAKAPCSPVRPNLAACALLGDGKVAEGGLCRVRDECGAHGYCHPKECLPNRPACCTGICMPVPANTGTPACSDPCPEGTWCLAPSDAAGGAPACRPLAQAGESCAARPCAGEKLLCSDGICRARGAPGDACKDSGWCLPWAACVGGACRAKSRLGEACSHTDDCASGSCASGTCAATPPKHPCTPIADDVYGCIDFCPRDAGPRD